MKNTAVWVNRSNLEQTRIVEGPRAPLSSGELRIEIEKFALTSNNVTYAVSGDFLGYWQFFPTDDQAWGQVTVWGVGTVSESQCPEVAVGERLYGFFPMAQSITLLPGAISDQGFNDINAHRRALPAVYNHYLRLGKAASSALLQEEDARCVYFPLFMTGYVIADLLQDNNWYQSRQIVIGSASSKTGFSTAAFLREAGFSGHIVGLTSAPNRSFCESLGFYSQIFDYGQVANVQTESTVYVDMSGDIKLRSALHHQLGNNIHRSFAVGATHWQQFGDAMAATELPGAVPELFFAPAQIEKRNQDWGQGVIMRKAQASSSLLTKRLGGHLSFEYHSGADALIGLWTDALANSLSGSRSIMVSLQDGAF